MFTKKYIFETRKTRLKRYFFNTGLLFSSLGFLYVGLAFYCIYVARTENDMAAEYYYHKSPDLVVIFTGDIGRIPYGIHKALEYENAKIFISGVYTSNTIMDLLRTQYPELLEQIDLRPDLIEIDYLARNTLENVLSTLRYLRMEQNLKKVLIVSSDYHILRIKFILEKIKSPSDQFHFNFIGIESNFTQWRGFKILFKEVFKTMKSYAFLLLWDSEYNQQGKLGNVQAELMGQEQDQDQE